MKRSAMVEMETMGSLFGETILCDADADAAIYGLRAGWEGGNSNVMEMGSIFVRYVTVQRRSG